LMSREMDKKLILQAAVCSGGGPYNAR